MSILDNEQHFLHKHITYIVSLSETDSFHYFEKLGIDVSGDTWDGDHSTFNWSQIEPHFQFFYDFEGNEKVISQWLQASNLRKYDFVVVRLQEEIIKIKTDEFIENWYTILFATGFM